MTISSLPARVEYTSTAGQTQFSYTFRIYTNADLNVYVTPAGQDCEDSDLTTDYVIDPGTINDPAGGFITFNSPLNAGDKVTINSAIEENREVDYQNNGDFRPVVVNADFDRTVSLVKQLSTEVSRSLTFPECTQNTTDLEMPSGDRDQVFLGFDENGDPEFIPYADASVPTVIIEDTYILDDGETTATFTKLDTRNTGFYVIGDLVDQGRLKVGIDYNIVTNTSISLTESYPAGTQILAVQNDPTSQPKAPFVPDATTGSAAEINALRDALILGGLMLPQ